ncbi:MAG TPA: ATP-binding protein, partial [Candidatus Ozemobacteraceae bacterium]|nr:ATP-binding protein [Candidatus Ozemobacteraceae bacterium]
MSSAMEILPVADRWQPDVILIGSDTDPGSTLSACRALRSMDTVCSVPVMIVAPQADRRFRMLALSSGADEVFSSMDDAAEMVVRLSNMLGMQRFRRTIAETSMFSTVAEQAVEAVAVIGEDLRVRYANTAAGSDFGLHADDGTTWLEMLAGRHTLVEPLEWAQAVASGRMKSLSMYEKRFSGDRARWFSCQVFPVFGDPEGRAAIIIRDVTGRVRSEDLILGMKRFVLHKLLTPLNGIVAPLELIRAGDVSDEEKSTLSGMAFDNALRLNEAVSAMSRFFDESDVPSGPGFVRMRDIPVIIGECATQFSLRGVSLLSADDVDCDIPISPPSLRAVVEELFSNSVRFHPDHLPKIEVAVSSSESRLRIEISDDGPGVPSASFASLGSPFYIPDGGMTGDLAGVGLGLAQVLREVAAAGG